MNYKEISLFLLTKNAKKYYYLLCINKLYMS